MRTISLFSGAGGLDLGFKKAGFNIIWANENDKKIIPTYKYNNPETFLNEKSIKDVENNNIPDDIDCLIGGPPCQSWSLAGNMQGKLDKRGALIDDYVRIVKYTKPKFFVFENVKGILSTAHIQEFKILLKSLQNLGYKIEYKLLNSVDYGVAQTRERVFIIGNSLNIPFKFPNKIAKKLTLKDVIGDVKNQIPFCQETSMFDANEYFVGSFSSIFMSRNRIRKANEQSFTIQASGRQTPLHYSSPQMIKIAKDKFIFDGDISKVRRFSVKECARIQSFPDSYKFIYKNINDAYKMIGNAVPVNMAYALAREIKKILLK